MLLQLLNTFSENILALFFAVTMENVTKMMKILLCCHGNSICKKVYSYLLLFLDVKIFGCMNRIIYLHYSIFVFSQE